MSNVIQNHEITKETYDKLLILKNTNMADFHKCIEKIADSSSYPPNAYGCEIPIKVYEENGKYYASWSRWSSCD